MFAVFILLRVSATVSKRRCTGYFGSFIRAFCLEFYLKQRRVLLTKKVNVPSLIDSSPLVDFEAIVKATKFKNAFSGSNLKFQLA